METHDEGSTVDAVEQRVRDTAASGLSRAAEAAHKTEDWARRKGGAAARAAPSARDAGLGLERASTYVRQRELHGMRADLEREVHREPLKTLLMAAAVGFLLGRILR